MGTATVANLKHTIATLETETQRLKTIVTFLEQNDEYNDIRIGFKESIRLSVRLIVYFSVYIPLVLPSLLYIVVQYAVRIITALSDDGRSNTETSD